MSNHVTHRVVVTGPEAEVRRFRETTIRPSKEDGQECLDCQTLVAMPDCLKKTTAGYNTCLGVEILTGRPKPCPFFPDLERSFLNYDWVRAEGVHTIEQLRAWAEKKHPEALVDGR